MRPDAAGTSDGNLRSDEMGTDGRQLAVFAVLWASASLFHIWNQLSYTPTLSDSIIAAVGAVMALAVIAKPSSLSRWIMFLTWDAAYGLVELPRVANHRFLTIFVDIAILASFVVLVIRHRRLWVPAGELFQSFTPCVRLMFAVSYGLAAIAKFNWGFLDVQVSCAAVEYRTINEQWLTSLPGDVWVQYLSIGGTLFCESAVALSLMVPRLRHFGVMLGSVFHFLLSATPIVTVPDFSAMLFALFYLFSTPGFTSRLCTFAAKQRGFRFPLSYAMTVAWIGVLLAATALLLIHTPDNHAEPYSHWLKFFTFFFYGLNWCFFLLCCGRAGQKEAVEPLVRNAFTPVRNPLHIALVSLTVLSVLSPYLGLKTSTAFTMFSNLRTENNESNHLFMPQLYLVDFQNDLVQIIDSSHEHLRTYTDKGLLIPWFELVNFTSRHPEISLCYVRGSREYTVPCVGDDPQLSRFHPWLLRKTLLFRPVFADGSCECQW